MHTIPIHERKKFTKSHQYVNGEPMVSTTIFQISEFELWTVNCELSSGNRIFLFEKVESWQNDGSTKKYLLFLREKLFDKM